MRWARVMIWLTLAWGVVCVGWPLFVGVTGWPTPKAIAWSPAPLVVVPIWLRFWLVKRADPIYDKWPWNRNAAPPEGE